MNQLLFYSKLSMHPDIPEILEWKGPDKKEVLTRVTGKGGFCLFPYPAANSVSGFFQKAGFIDCGEKEEYMDLKRALKFDEKKNRDKPKQVFFNSSNAGAFKRGINAFYSKHYTQDDPACLILVPQPILEQLIGETVAAGVGGSMMQEIDERDPFFQLIRIPHGDERMARIAENFVGNSIQVQHTRSLVYRASCTDSPVLILGESGTGKDVIATQIYENSTRYKKGFYRINCSALQESLLEGEMFGYKKGIFTGAVADKKGLFNDAEKGTIFLDEIGDLSPLNQAKLLHAVEKKEIRQMGSNIGIPVDVRIIAATNRNLDAMMMRSAFRDDLYYRISTFKIWAPSLREHPDDIPLLVAAHWKRKGYHGTLSDEFLNYLKAYHWPGNVRELFSILNSVVDYFGDVSPMPRHIEAIRKSRQETLLESGKPGNDADQLFRAKSQNLLITVQNILRSVKVEMRPFLNDHHEGTDSNFQLERLREFILQQVHMLDQLCLEPSYFMSWEVFKETARYKYMLDTSVKQAQLSPEVIRNYWVNELKSLDDQINKGIMSLLWEKIDL